MFNFGRFFDTTASSCRWHRHIGLLPTPRIQPSRRLQRLRERRRERNHVTRADQTPGDLPAQPLAVERAEYTTIETRTKRGSARTSHSVRQRQYKRRSGAGKCLGASMSDVVSAESISRTSSPSASVPAAWVEASGSRASASPIRRYRITGPPGSGVSAAGAMACARRLNTSRGVVASTRSAISIAKNAGDPGWVAGARRCDLDGMDGAALRCAARQAWEIAARCEDNGWTDSHAGHA